jgi:hypothetical protein
MDALNMILRLNKGLVKISEDKLREIMVISVEL